MYESRFMGKTALITGHTGFKGAWLALYLLRLGTRVVGYSLPPPTTPSLFENSALQGHITHFQGDIRDTAALSQVLREYKPDFIFHMAAQPIVMEAYRNPRETFDVNVMGSISVMEALRTAIHPCIAIMVITDKCYENREWQYGYREIDPLGGYDPYSASKAAMDIAVSSYRLSFFNPKDWQAHGVRIAQVRSGNVVGGGDWAINRIIPDAIKAFTKGEKLIVRNPRSIRPWQHVLEPLSGYLWLAAMMARRDGDRFATAYNFGPQTSQTHSVGDLADALVREWDGSAAWVDAENSSSLHEATQLKLNIDKANSELGWMPIWDFDTTVHHTVAWYKRALTVNPAKVYELCVSDIMAYEATAKEKNVAWVQAS